MKFQTLGDGSTLVVERADLIAVARDGDGCSGCVFDEGEFQEDCFEHACFAENFPEGHLLRDTPHRIIWVRKD
ncbi:hypothetical protein [Burkholderia ubonensis]|uniref:hypothetical protein n=1 Tax=Burkholderia ubonensis TaxID=101571 RepID=UPI0018DF227A|nr:hypothetical protein [Burkholderia ubonensis]